MFKNILTVFMLWAPLTFAGESGLDFKIRFEKLDGLEAGAGVIFDGNTVGTVEKVFFTEEGDYIVDVVVKDSFKNAATEFSTFYIVEPPDRSDKAAVEIILARKGGNLIKSGSTVTGSNNAGAVPEQWIDIFKNKMTDIKDRFHELSREFSEIPESEEMRKLEKSLEDLTEDLKKTGDSIRKKLKEDVLDNLEQELEKLRERLKELDREKEMKPLDNQIKKIREI